MFKYERESYEVRDAEDELFYNVMFGKVFGIYSPFEVDDTVEFPKKDRFGGVVLKFVGGGSAYFKVQRQMPSMEEIDSVVQVCRFLQKSFGQYVVAYILCEPHIEIRNIKVREDEKINITYVSSRKNDGDEVLLKLTEKLENNEKFTIEDYISKFTVPFMSRKDDDKFQENYSKFIEEYRKSEMELPTVKDLLKHDVKFNRIF
nr:hypothetical protein [uncultured Methanobrevibacter sp.]